MSVLLLRAKDIYRMEGLISLLRTSFDYVKRRVFEYRSYYLYEIPTGELDEADFLPQIGNFMFKVISSNEEADELAASFGFDLRQRFIDAKKRLDKAAIAFCIFVGKEFANIGWVSLSEEAKKTLDPLPLKVDFAANEAYVVLLKRVRNTGIIV